MTVSRPGTWYLFDYGMVISTAPEPGDWEALRRETGRDLQAASSPYWTHREDFDAGRLSPGEYWGAVLGQPDPGEDRVRVLEALDAAQWSHLNTGTLELLADLGREGARLALLSNMPRQMSLAYQAGASWPQFFEHTFFSGQLGLAKPDRRVFGHVLHTLQAAPGDVVFIDDNLLNVEAARSLGMRAVHFGPGTDLRRELSRP